MKNNMYKLFSILLVVATLFMGVGYASINSISLDISGELSVAKQDGIFITDVTISNDNFGQSHFINAHQNNLNSVTILDNDDANCTVTYTITIYNDYDVAYSFAGVDYILGDSTYSNENIIFDLVGLNEGDIVNGNDFITFDLVFLYKNSTLSADNILKSILSFNFVVPTNIFEYSGKEETFVVNNAGLYKIELWGAEGGQVSTFTSGKGAYTVGTVEFSEGDTLYINVGGMGIIASDASILTVGGYNGGGGAYYSAGTGGGATDVRFEDSSLNARIMVAAGGGGTGVFDNLEFGGSGGTLLGKDGGNYISETYTGFHGGFGGSQITGGKFGDYWTGVAREDCFLGTSGAFGIGGNGGYELKYVQGSGGGGGGYYGGGGGSERNGGGAGGSSYISGHAGCVAITSATDTTPLINTSTTDVKYSYHYSGKIFQDSEMISGDDLMPNYDATDVISGNTGNGYAKITLIEKNKY